MPSQRVSAVCANGHIQSVAETLGELSADPHCQRCGGQVYHACPNCQGDGVPIRVYQRERDDGSYYWSVPDHCHNCGQSYPWVTTGWRKVLHNIGEGLAKADTSPTPSGTVLTESRTELLNEIRYGSEVIQHVREGDGCYRHRLWHPALSMYIHGYEWAAIAYLEAEADVDIIHREQEEDVYYTLAGRDPRLIDELTKHVEIDQKTLSRIDSMNQAERRWMAHHKSGQTLRDDVDAVRSRLGTFVGILFD